MPKPTDNSRPTLEGSWDANASRWTRAVRNQAIASRAAATDQAIVEAVKRRAAQRVIDIGCGEGWLVRRLKQEIDCHVSGIDGSARLIANAIAADPNGRYEVLCYRQLDDQAVGLQAPYDVAICNFALLDDALVPTLTSIKRLLSPTGALIIQTLHPYITNGDLPYVDGWRREDFSTFDDADWEPMPWYFRTFSTWLNDIETAGYTLANCHEPTDPITRKPLSVIFECRPS